MISAARETQVVNSLSCLEAPVGIEPTNRGFADLCLTTWLRRRPHYAATNFNTFPGLSCRPLQTSAHTLGSLARGLGKCPELGSFSTHRRADHPERRGLLAILLALAGHSHVIAIGGLG